MWVWSTKTHLAANDGPSLADTCKVSNVTEVYLGVDRGILAAPQLPALVTALTSAGIRVAALMGDASWYLPANRSSMLTLIDMVGAYNAKVPAAARFSGLHLDIEPWQLAANKGVLTYLDALADTLAAGRARADTYGLDTAADVARFVITDRPDLHHAFASAVPRIFLMLYELADKSTPAMVKAANATATLEFQGELGGVMVIGVSVDDYPDVRTNLRALDAALPGGAHYGGWAIHDERRYRARLDANGW